MRSTHQVARQGEKEEEPQEKSKVNCFGSHAVEVWEKRVEEEERAELVQTEMGRLLQDVPLAAAR